MRRFVIKCVCMAVWIGLLLQLVATVRLRSGDAGRRVAAEVYDAQARSRALTQAPTIFLGDSVSHQLILHRDPAPERIHDLTCNAAISLAGHWLLLRQFAERNPMRGRRVVLAYHPDSFIFNLDDKFSFGYFVRPFNRAPYARHFTDLVRSRVRSVPLQFLVHLPSVRASDWSPRWVPRPAGDSAPHYPRLSAVSVEALRAIQTMAAREGFRLHVASPPVSEETYARFDMAAFYEQSEREGLGDVFRPYRETLQVLPRDWFRDNDPIHFRAAALPSVRWPVLDDPLANSGD